MATRIASLQRSLDLRVQTVATTNSICRAMTAGRRAESADCGFQVRSDAFVRAVTNEKQDWRAALTDD